MTDPDPGHIVCTCVWDGVRCRRRAELIVRTKEPPYHRAYCSRCRQRSRPHGKEDLAEGGQISEDEALVLSVMEEPAEPRPKWEWPSWKLRPGARWRDDRFTVRMYDPYDGWIDVSRDLTAEEAEAKWLEKTAGGTKHFEYRGMSDHYYDIFPSDTRMVWSSDVMDP